MIDCLGNEVIPLEKQDPEIGAFIESICNKKKPYGIEGLYIGQTLVAINKGKGWKNWEDPVVIGEKVNRNDPCICGSNKKYKKCCGRN